MVMREQGDKESQSYPMGVGQRYSVKGFSKIGVITPGTSYIQNIKFYYPAATSTVVTTVPAGEQFDFSVDYRCVNSAGSAFDLWSMCIVWFDTVDGPGLPTASAFKLNGWYWKDTNMSLDLKIIDDNLARLNNANPYLIMPARNVVLKFNMFANDDHSPVQKYPDPSAWQQHI